MRRFPFQSRRWIEIALIGMVLAPALLGLLRKQGSLHFLLEPVDFLFYLDAARSLQAGGTAYTGSYLYPPLLAGALRPLASLPVPAAALIWDGLNLIAIVVVVVTFARAARLGARGTALAATGILLFPATYNNLLLGQVNLIIAAIVMSTVTLSLRGPDHRRGQVLAGALLGLAAAIKVYPLLFAIPLVFYRRWTALAGVGVAFVGAGLLGIAIGGGIPETLHYWMEVLPQFALGEHARIENQSLRGGFVRLLAGTTQEIPVSFTAAESARVTLAPVLPWPAAAELVGRVLSLSVLAIALAAMVQVRRRLPGSDGLHASFALIVTTYLLASSVVWNYYYLLLLVPVSLLVRWRTLDLLWLRLVCYAAALCIVMHRFWIPLAYFTEHSLLTVFGLAGVVLVWGLLLVVLWRASTTAIQDRSSLDHPLPAGPDR